MNADEILGRMQKKPTLQDVRLPAREHFRICQELNPSLWNLFNRKVYAHVDKYNDPRYVSAFCTSVMDYIGTRGRELGADLVKDKETRDSAGIEKAIWCSSMVRHGMPLFFVSRDLLAAALSTRLPDIINWDELKLPFDAACFVLPVNSMRTVVGGQTGWVGYIKLQPNTYHLDPLNIEIEYKGKAWMALAFDTADGVESYRLSYQPDYDTTHRSADLPYKASFDAYQNISGVNATASDFREYTSNITNLVFNLLLLMQHKPELLTPARHIGHVKKSHKELWSPNIIGRDYKIKIEYQGGTHASPRWHWRAGHWRNQPIGAKTCKCGHAPAAHDRAGECKMNGCFDRCRGWVHSDVKRIFIDPVLINGDQIAEGNDGLV